MLNTRPSPSIKEQNSLPSQAFGNPHFGFRNLILILIVLLALLGIYLAYQRQQQQQISQEQQQQQEQEQEQQLIQQQQEQEEQQQQQQNLGGVPISQGNATLESNSNSHDNCFNLDTGTVATTVSVCELGLNDQMTLVLEGRTTVAMTSSSVYFSDITLGYLKAQYYSTQEIYESQLTRGFVFGVQTPQGNYAKVQIMYLGPGYLQFQWVTYSGSS